MIVNRNEPARLRVTNTLPTPNIIPVDITLPGANQAQNRIAVHLHGGEVPWPFDGGPFDWWTPSGQRGLSFLNGPGGFLDNLYPAALRMAPGQADFYYPNIQSTRLMWYHDHAHGITRINAYAGLASAYLIIDAAQDAKLTNGLPPITSTFPLVFQDKKFVDPATIVLTDPAWSIIARPDVQSLGSLWYEHIYNPKEFRLLKSKKYLTPPDPSAIPEFFGDTMLSNGLVYPLLTVEAKRYRFFALNACNARFLNINLLQVAPGAPDIVTNPKTLLPNLAVNPPGPQIIQIGTEAGYLLQDVYHPNNRFFNPATLTGNLLLGPGERSDIIIDFTGREGQEFIMYNDAPGPFPAGPATFDYFLGNPKNPVQPLAGTGPDTRNILRIKVIAGVSSDPQTLPVITNPVDFIDPPLLATPVVNAGVPQPLSIANVTNIPAGATLNPTPRDLTLNESFDGWGRLEQLLGTTTPNPVTGAFGRFYLDTPTEVIPNKTVEVWRVFNLTADTHPIHFHLNTCQVLARQPFRVIAGVFTPTGVARGCEPNELGWKETVQMHPGEMTTVAFYFNLPDVSSVMDIPPSPRTGGNEFVWHCHILEHEEHDMMRPLVIT
jgi:spore coat protein A